MKLQRKFLPKSLLLFFLSLLPYWHLDVLFFSNSVSLAWIYATKYFLNDKHKTKIFSKNPLTTLEHSIDLLSEIGFYAALYMVALTFTIMMTRIFNHSTNPAVMSRL
jgi:hypothetical protein